MASAHGLPFAVMTDRRGQVCALHQGIVRPATVAEMDGACQQGQ
jgi:hypothetical protein